MKIGYIRVSTEEQNTARQEILLRDLGVDELFIDKGNIKGFQLAGLLLDLEDSLGRSVDLVPTTSLDQRFLDSIHDDEVLLYEAS